MELRERIEDINKLLLENYGKYLDGRPNFRVVFSEDQYENRMTNYTDEGFQLINPEVRLLPKYRQFIQQKYILERLLPVVGETDLTEKTSYEPAWVFMDKNGGYLPPFYDGCVLVIESLLSASGKKNTHTKYKDESLTPEARAAELDRVQNELFGNETAVGDHLNLGTGIVVPGNNTVN